MNRYITYLSDLLDKEIASFRAMVSSLEMARQALVQNDVVALGQAVEAQKEQARCIAQQERDRTRIAQQMATAIGEDPKTLTLQRLIDLVDAPLTEPLRARRETLLVLQEDVNRLNRQNSLLLKQSMKYVDKSLRILSGAAPGGNTYERSGKAETRNTSALPGIVNQVI